ncbi:hypothetical protein FHX10_003418 [Rhizobium sp. BK591]|uniref:Gp138 family membrane-puncturing spike protein n=1 Tax=Rhizobium sp. BK591 TaxID=2586985 RepID=UPI00161D1AB3|nr:Gp138 family membrane-puncturing spike protein [Rhizobium sp. BK591]MBB3743919.1 hypothetical protein [Rhizobium sp. BK591]
MTEGFFGQRGITDGNDLYNTIRFMIQQELRETRTAVPVKIVGVHGGGVGAAPTVDVQPMVTQIDGQGNQTPHGVIYGLPVSRNQGGNAAVINDPVVGDVGHIVISDRDTSALRSNDGAQSNPGSFRHHNLADGVYHGAMLNPATPNRYINFNGPGISIADEFGNTIVTSSAGITLNGVLIDRNGNIGTPGGVTAGVGTSDSVTLQHHRHAGGPPPDPGT